MMVYTFHHDEGIVGFGHTEKQLLKCGYRMLPQPNLLILC